MTKQKEAGTEAAAPAAPPARRLTRRGDDRIIAGVASGIADYFGIEPVWVRIVFAASVVLGGVGVFLYLVLWLILPVADAGTMRPSIAEQRGPRIVRSARDEWIGIALLVVGVLVVAHEILEWRSGIFWGIGLVVLGVLLFRQRDDVAAGPATHPAPPAEGTVPPPAAPQPPVVPGPPPPPRRPRPPRSPLGALTIGAAMIALGAAAALDAADVVNVTFVAYIALLELVLGIGLLVGAWYGRARWLAVPGLMLIPVLMGASVIDVPLEGGVGERYYAPRTIGEVRPVYRIAAGRLVVDLRHIEATETPLAIEATVGAGELVVWVPAGAAVDVRARAGMGSIRLFGRQFDGISVDVRRAFGGEKPKASFVLDLHASLGEVQLAENGEPFLEPHRRFFDERRDDEKSSDGKDGKTQPEEEALFDRPMLFEEDEVLTA